MSAPDTTKFQVNYKLNDGTLINLYATSVTELESGLADLAMNALNIKTTGSDLGSWCISTSIRTSTCCCANSCSSCCII
jgi:hypothetical protein